MVTAGIDLDYDCGVRQAENLSKDYARLSISIVVRLQSRHDEVSILITNCFCQNARGSEGRKVHNLVANHMNCAIGAARQRVFDHALRALWPHRNDHDFAAHFFLDAQRFFERIAIRLVHFERQIGFFDPGEIFIDAQDRVLVRDLLH